MPACVGFLYTSTCELSRRTYYMRHYSAKGLDACIELTQNVLPLHQKHFCCAASHLDQHDIASWPAELLRNDTDIVDYKLPIDFQQDVIFQE